MNNQTAPLELQDIHGPIAPLGSAIPWLYLLAIALLVLILAAALYWYFRRRRPAPPVAIAPGVMALRQLEEARGLRRSEQAVAYLAEVSVILRQYIEAQFRIPLTRQTTAEFFARLQADRLATTSLLPFRAELRRCLELCDLGKYAHCGLAAADMEQLEEAIRAFIEQSDPAVGSTGRK